MNHISIREIPDNERPYEKFFSYGAKALNDTELLAVILRTGVGQSSAIEIARSILSNNVINNKIENLHKLEFEDLIKIPGIGKIRGAQLVSILELSKRISKSSAEKELLFSAPASIANYYMQDLCHECIEKVVVMFLNSKGCYLGEKTIFMGTATASLASPREIFIEAIRYNAVNIIFIHNHPSGDPTPSDEDILLTRKLTEAGLLIQIPLIDHIIIGNNRYFSFREKGYIY